MKLYHGSYTTVEKPDISFSRNNIDFGKGFYVTPIKEQAIKWSLRFKARRKKAIVSIYEIDIDKLKQDVKIMEFNTYSDDWFDYIIRCRSGNASDNYDVIIGGVANDKVFDTIQLYIDGLIDKSESIKRLRYEKPNIQYCFRNQHIIDKFLLFINSEEQ